MKNADSQIIHYAKGWFEKNDVVEDLKILYGERNGINPRYLGKGSIASQLLKLCFKHMELNVYAFADFIMSLSPNERWKNYGYYREEEYEFNKAVIYRCLSALSILQVMEDKRVIVPLDEPDYSILPKKRNGNKLDKKITK